MLELFVDLEKLVTDFKIFHTMIHDMIKYKNEFSQLPFNQAHVKNVKLV